MSYCEYLYTLFKIINNMLVLKTSLSQIKPTKAFYLISRLFHFYRISLLLFYENIINCVHSNYKYVYI